MLGQESVSGGWSERANGTATRARILERAVALRRKFESFFSDLLAHHLLLDPGG
jgi:hypothetical protein